MAATKAVHECLFCPQTFNSAATKDDHVLEHFAQETCTDCNQNLIRIGSNLYNLHNTASCATLGRQSVCKRQSLSDDEEHGDDSVISEAELVTEIEIKTETIEPNEQPVLNEFDESSECDSEDERDDKLGFDSDSSMDVDAYEDICSSIQNKYSKTNTGRIECPLCEAKMSKQGHLRRHMKMTHDPCKKFRCCHCKSVYVAEISLKKHLRQCKRRKELNYGDEILEHEMIEFHGTTDLETYKKYWSSLPTDGDADIGQFECPICEKIYEKLYFLLEHMKLQHDPRNKYFRCVNCSIVFLKKSSLKEHLLQCQREKKSATLDNQLVKNQGCEADNAMDLEKYNEFWSQLPEDKSLGRFTCPICENEFTKKYFLLKHMKLQHDPSCKKFKCVHCKNKFLSESSLENHIPRCTKRNSNTRTLRFVDNTVNPNYVSGNPLDLQTYRDIYSRLVNDKSHCADKGKYECPICKKVVTKLVYLRTHMKMKHDPRCKKFKCIYCSIVYVTEISLEKHLPRCKKRRDVVPKLVNQFECSICKSRLATFKILQIHMNRQHDPNRETFKCAQCNRIFRVKSSLKYHLPRCTKRKRES